MLVSRSCHSLWTQCSKVFQVCRTYYCSQLILHHILWIDFGQVNRSFISRIVNTQFDKNLSSEDPYLVTECTSLKGSNLPASRARQAAAWAFRSLLSVSILACQKRPRKEFKRYPTVNPNSSKHVSFCRYGTRIPTFCILDLQNCLEYCQQSKILLHRIWGKLRPYLCICFEICRRSWLTGSFWFPMGLVWQKHWQHQETDHAFIACRSTVNAVI